nr:hypothetical protein [Tanacetum cinerariifolium]
MMALCTTLQNKVLDLEKTMTTQGNEIASLKRRVKKLEKKNRSRTHRLKRLYKVSLMARVESYGNNESLGEDASKQGRIDAFDVDEEITLRKDQIRFDKETALKLQAAFDEEGRLAREKAKKVEEANIALIEHGIIYRAGTELIQEITKKKNVEDDKETLKLKQFMEIIPDEEEVAIDAISLSVKSPKIVN